MTRDIVETQRITGLDFDEVSARLEKNSHADFEMPSNWSEANSVFKYEFREEIAENQELMGEIQLQKYDDSFKARGDREFIKRYFNSYREVEI